MTHGTHQTVVDDSMVRARRRCAADGTYAPISWTELVSLIRGNDLAALTRSPSDLIGYYEWKRNTVREYGSVETFLLKERLGWWCTDDDAEEEEEEKEQEEHAGTHVDGHAKHDANGGGMGSGRGGRPDTKPVSSTPFECDEDWKLLRNDFPYGVEKGIEHVVVWMKNALAKTSPDVQEQQSEVQDGRDGSRVGGQACDDTNTHASTDAHADADASADASTGVLTHAAKETLETFLYGRLFKDVRREDILYFLNPPSLKSIEGLEHFHILLRNTNIDGL